MFETAKVAPRRPCDFAVEVNGSRGTLRFDYSRLNELWYGDADEPAELYGMRRIRAEHPIAPRDAGWWPIGQGIGYGASFVNQAADLLAHWPDGEWTPDLGPASRCRRCARPSSARQRSGAGSIWREIGGVSLGELRRRGRDRGEVPMADPSLS